MRLLRHSLLFIFLLLIYSSSTAQTWETFFAKTEKKFAKGQYAKIPKDLKKLRSKTIPKKYDNDSALLALTAVMELRAKVATKDYSQMDALTDEALLLLENQKGVNDYAYNIGMLKLVDLYNEYGNFRKANSLMDLLKRDFYYYSNDLIPNEILIREATTLTNNGFFRQADSVNKIVINVWPTLYEKSYDGEVANKIDIEYRKALMASIFMTDIKIKSLGGNYEDALDLHNQRQKEINRLAPAKSFTSNQYKMLEVELLYNYGDYKQARKINSRLIAENPVGNIYENALLNQLEILYKINEEEIKVADIESIGKLLSKHYSKQKVNKEYQKFTQKYILAHVLNRKGNTSLALTNIGSLRNTSTEIMPREHMMKERMLRSAISISLQGDPKYQLGAEEYYTALGKALELKYVHNSITKNFFDIELSGFYLKYSEKPGTAFKILSSRPYEHILQEVTYKHHQLPDVFNSIEEYLIIRGDYEYGIDLVSKIIKGLEDNPNTPETVLGEHYESMAKMQIHGGYYKEAEINTDLALKLIRKGGDKISAEYVTALSSAAVLYGTIGVYDKAEKLLNRSESIAKKLNDKTVFLKSIEDLAFLMTRIGKYSETELLLNTVIAEKTTLYGEQSRKLIKPYKALGELQLIKGEYPQAEKNIRKAIDLTKEIYGDTTLLYAENLSELVNLYIQLGNYESGIFYCNQVIDIRKKILKPDHILFNETNNQLGNLYYNLEADFAKVESYFIKARDLVELNFDKKHPLYAEALKNIAFLDVQYDELDNALVLLNQADDIWEEAIGSRSKSSGEVARLKGDIYSYKQDFSKARKEYEKSARYFKQIFSDEHPDYLNTRSKLARSYFINNEQDRVVKILNETTTSYLNYTNKFFPTLSEEEKSKFWYKIKPDFEFYNTLAIGYSADKPKYIENMYDFALVTKGLLLSSSIKTRQSIINSGDTTLIILFEKWTNGKEYLANTLARTPEDLEESGIDLDQIREEILELEKELSTRSTAFADAFEEHIYTWQDVRKSLNDNEAAVEIVRFREFDTDFNKDKVRYAALVVTKETKKNPILIYIENGNELEGRFFNAQRASVKYKVDNTSSYQNFWAPVQQAIGEKDIVYLSPDGIYNQLNVESLLIGDGKYVIDNYNVRVVNSTKTLITSRSRQARKARKLKDTEGLTAMLFGNPDYYKKKEDQIFVSDTATRSIQLDFVPQLPGTEKEVNVVSDILKQNGWNIKSYVGEKASEEAIKGMKDATLIHIATHGFFDDDPTIKENKFGVMQKDNPLDRSGILTYGGGDLLKKSHGNYNVEDGILTAHEAMTLNFDKTELVILSACETGRGEIQQGEGVFGLQRSFLVAGADAIIMSLFTVSDKVTQELMVEFYKNWINGDEKRVAFNKAQKTIKAIHPEPIYWGAFMMVSNE